MVAPVVVTVVASVVVALVIKLIELAFVSSSELRVPEVGFGFIGLLNATSGFFLLFFFFCLSRFKVGSVFDCSDLVAGVFFIKLTQPITVAMIAKKIKMATKVTKILVFFLLSDILVTESYRIYTLSSGVVSF